MSSSTLTIGQLAARAGLNPSAIRFYERAGVLPEPERVGGRRRYGEDTVRRLQVVEIAKRAGFSLDEVRLLLTAEDAGGPARDEIRLLADRKLAEVDALIARAGAMRAWLVRARECECSSLELCELFARDHPPG